ncbi:MAG: 3-hydroxybutyrate dehydrogenase [Pseudomonadota bacterium]
MTQNSLADTLDLSGRSVIVTGSTSGIGKAMADALAYAGCNVMLNGFGDANEIEAARKELADRSGRKIAYSGADLTNVEAIEGMFEEARAAFGTVDGVVNNAGVQHVSPVEEFPVAKWDLIIALNLTAAFHTTRLAFRDMKAQKWGRIINLCSAHGLVASPFKSAYVAAKHGVIGLTKTTALEGAEFGVRANAVCPGYVRTPLVEAQIGDTAKARGITEDEVVRDVLLAAQPTKEFVTVEEISSFVCFLMSDAARSINGAELKIDGGWTAQ